MTQFEIGRQRADKEIMDAFNREFIEDTRLEARDALRAVVASFDQALAERPDFPFPTPLMCAIEAARRVL